MTCRWQGFRLGLTGLWSYQVCLKSTWFISIFVYVPIFSYIFPSANEKLGASPVFKQTLIWYFCENRDQLPADSATFISQLENSNVFTPKTKLQKINWCQTTHLGILRIRWFGSPGWSGGSSAPFGGHPARCPRRHENGPSHAILPRRSAACCSRIPPFSGGVSC